MGQSLKIKGDLWLIQAYPWAISSSELMQMAFWDMSSPEEDYPPHLEPALQRAMMFHMELTKQ